MNTENIVDISKIGELCKEYNLEELRLNIAQDWSEDKSLSVTDHISGYSLKQIDYLKKNYSKNIKGKAPWTWSDCFWVKTGIYMTVEGNIKVCALNTDTKSLGNIFKDSIHEILNNKRMNEIAKDVKKMNLQNIVKIAHIKNCHLYWKN